MYVCIEEFRRPEKKAHTQKTDVLFGFLLRLSFLFISQERQREKNLKEEKKNVRKKSALPKNELQCEKRLNFFRIISHVGVVVVVIANILSDGFMSGPIEHNVTERDSWP